MEMTSLIELIDRLCQPGRRLRTGIWLVPSYSVGKEKDVVAQLHRNCDVVDLNAALLEQRPPNTQYSGLSPENLHSLVDSVLQKNVICDCAVLYHIDLLLAYLPGPERDQVWGILKNSFVHRQKALVFAIPQRSVGILLKEDIVESWLKDQRLAADDN